MTPKGLMTNCELSKDIMNAHCTGIGIEIDCLMLLDEIGCDPNEIDLIWCDSQDLTDLLTNEQE